VIGSAGHLLRSQRIERALLIGSVLLVLVVEILNSAIEAVVDRVGLERHELSGLAKDLGSQRCFCRWRCGDHWGLYCCLKPYADGSLVGRVSTRHPTSLSG